MANCKMPWHVMCGDVVSCHVMRCDLRVWNPACHVMLCDVFSCDVVSSNAK